MKYFILIQLFFLLMTTHSWAELPKLRWAISESNILPISAKVSESGQSVYKGIIIDLANIISKEMGKKPEFVSLSRKRLGQALINDEVDALCYTRPDWIPELNTENFFFTEFFIENFMVFLSKDLLTKEDVLEMKNQTIGTVRGFHYLYEDQIFKKNGNKRDDAGAIDSNFKKFLSGRISHLISDNLLILYYNKHKENIISYAKSFVVMESDPNGCVVSKKDEALYLKFKKATVKLQSNGAISKILSTYK